MAEKQLPRLFIVGGGFAGLAAAKALDGARAEVTIVDRRNHHVFQPLLYQVATAALSPADISASIRTVVRKIANCQVVLSEVIGVDVEKRRVIFKRGYAEYDYLILAGGATHAYFGHDEWATVAPGLKSLEDAITLRRRILLAFETAEYEGNLEARRAALTFGIVGGGPTGVELAGAIKEIAGQTLSKDFRHIDTTTTRVIIFQGGDRILPQFPHELSGYAKKHLEDLGVEVRLNARVTNITSQGLQVGEEFIPVRTVFWAAGVQANPLGKSLGTPVDPSGRVEVLPDLTIPGHPEVFVVGDLAAAKSAKSGEPVPGVAQGAIQMGHYAGSTIANEIMGRSQVADRAPFSYHDKGSLAVIGKARAVAHVGSLNVRGFTAWIVWAIVHIAFLIGFRNRTIVLLNWFWNWLLNSRDARLITGDSQIDVELPRSPNFVPNEAASERSDAKAPDA
ncbi:MAG TPA: NAD(P)/FAD-dependent oxidoreductase [Chthoniobacter sp.]